MPWHWVDVRVGTLHRIFQLSEAFVFYRFSSISSFRLLAASLALCALSACIGGGGDSPADSAATTTDTSSGTPGNLSITGTFFAPDGTTPIANALVYALAASTSSSGGAIGSIGNSGVITGTSISGVDRKSVV